MKRLMALSLLVFLILSQFVSAGDVTTEAINPNGEVSWKATASLNQYQFSPGDVLNLTVLIKDKYSEDLTFYTYYNIVDASGNTVKEDSLNLSSENQGFFDTYEIPDGYADGTSVINIELIDSDGTYALTNLEFSVSTSALEPETTEEIETIETETTEGTESPSDIGMISQYNTIIIWAFAIFTVIVIILITILRYRKVRKKKIEKKKEEEKKKENIYYKPQEEYRTEYY